MTRQILLRAPPSTSDRRHPLLTSTTDHHSSSGRKKLRMAEFAGGTTAACLALCCCCPCGLVDLIVLVVYKVPAGLCRKVLRRKRRLRLVKMGLFPAATVDAKRDEETTHQACSVTCPDDHDHEMMVVELEKEMWDNFYSGGFWRSVSQRSCCD